MNRHVFAGTYVNPLKSHMWQCLVSWGTWSDLCDFVPRPIFDRGVYLDEQGHITNHSNQRMGVILNGRNGAVIVPEGEWVGFAQGRYWYHTNDGWFDL